MRSFSIKPTRIVAADESADNEFEDIEYDDAQGIADAIDDVQDNIDDLQDKIDDVSEDSVDIAMNNNITNHYIAECDECQGVFISAVIASNQPVEYVSGTCPLCGKDSDQYLKWVIKDASEAIQRR